jgi:hypothetical protein
MVELGMSKGRYETRRSVDTILEKGYKNECSFMRKKAKKIKDNLVRRVIWQVNG